MEEQNNRLEGYKIVRKVVVPQLKLCVDEPVFILADSVLYAGKKLEDDKDPATLMNVINLSTGEQALIVVPTVLASILREEFEGDSYVGKMFRIVLRKVEGKKYHQVELDELEAI